MQLNHLADQLGTKTIHLIAIAKALESPDMLNPHGGTALNPDQAQQIAAVYRYMRDRRIADPKAAIAQMSNQPTDSDEITIVIRATVANELRERYPTGSMSDRILKALSALSTLERLYEPIVRSPISEANARRSA